MKFIRNFIVLVVVWFPSFSGRNARLEINNSVAGFVQKAATNARVWEPLPSFSRDIGSLRHLSFSTSRTSLNMIKRRRFNFMGIFSSEELQGRGYAYSKATSNARSLKCQTNAVPTSKSIPAPNLSELARKPVAVIKTKVMNLGLIYSQYAKQIRKLAASKKDEAWRSTTGNRQIWNGIDSSDAGKQACLRGRGDAYSFLLKHQSSPEEAVNSHDSTSDDTKKQEAKPANLGQAYSFYVLRNKEAKEKKSISSPSIIDNLEHTVRTHDWPSHLGNAVCTPSIYNIYKRRKGD